MIFDATKVTYSMYSCTISGMSRETMKMDGRDSAEYQIWEMEGHNGYFGIRFKSQDAKIANSASSPTLSQSKKRGKHLGRSSSLSFESFLEREGASL